MSTSRPPTRPYARPQYPPLQSTSSTPNASYQSYQSSSSISSSTLSTPSPASSAAPLPSPQAAHPQHQGFFGSLHPSQQRNQLPQQPQQQFATQNQFPREPLARQNSYEYQPNRDGAGRTAAETNNLLNDYSLVAEAAKRAQMAVLMRDMDAMEM